MAISFKKYVDILSGVGAGAGVRQRDLIGRLFTTNPLLPTQSFIEFTTPEDVAEYFGDDSAEYKRAAWYFSFISKNITQPKKISFARWADAATAPLIYGKKADRALANFTSIDDGSFSLTMGAFTYVVSGIDLTGAASFAAIAALLQTGIRAKTGGGALWTNATVSYDAVRKSFNLVGGATGNAVISTAAGNVGTTITGLLGWFENDGAILSDGVVAETLTETLTASADASNNFGAIAFIPTLTLDDWIEIGTWNGLSTQNLAYQVMVPVLAVDAATYEAALADFPGLGVTLLGEDDADGEYPEMAPMVILAATDYNKRNSVQNYMFQILRLTPSVKTTQLSNTYDALRINYYGQTQTAGQFIQFYQRGTLMGLPSAPSDMNVYANEQWLKDAAGAKIMELLLNLARVSANTQGRSSLISVLQSVINQALFNGTISVGKTLTDTQKVYIGSITGDENAWHQVQNIGYWLDCVITPFVNTNGTTEYKAVYALVYSKDDAIRKVEGTHTLI